MRIVALEERVAAVDAVAERALVDDLDPEAETIIRDTLETAERVLRRRRVLGGA